MIIIKKNNVIHLIQMVNKLNDIKINVSFILYKFINSNEFI
jgi:hypothetical protein